MATADQVRQFSQRIFTTAVGGTPTNPRGVPNTLANLLIAMAMHESDSFSSRAFVEGNNAFGYTYVPGARWQLATPGRIADNGQALAQYGSIERSTGEVVDWIYRRVKQGVFPANLDSIRTPDQFAGYLKRGKYYEDSFANYSTGLERYFYRLKQNGGWVWVTLGVGVIVLFHKQLKKLF